MGARPLEFDQAIADTICERIMNRESLRSITGDQAMPASSTVFKWLSRVPSFAEQYERAREAQADALADEIVDISDAGSDDPQRDRLRVDTRKWVAAKLKPKKYGDKQQVEHSGVVQVDYTARIRAEIDEVLGRSAPLQIEGGDDGK